MTTQEEIKASPGWTKLDWRKYKCIDCDRDVDAQDTVGFNAETKELRCKMCAFNQRYGVSNLRGSLVLWTCPSLCDGRVIRSAVSDKATCAVCGRTNKQKGEDQA